ncbi:MAG: hypothetical protein KC414_14875 [Romboutsia sp.]|nr:hypothetical protein [Romboutsia sp.]
MKNREYSIKGLVFAFAFFWAFGSGIIVSRFFLEPTRVNVKTNEVYITDPKQEEHHLIAVTTDEPRYVYVVEYVDKLNSKETSQKGYAHLTYSSLDSTEP